MSLDATLNEEYVLSCIKDLRQLRGQSAKKASRIQGKRKKGSKCFACEGYRHLTRDCSNRQNQEEDAGSATEKSGKKKDQKKLSKKKATKQKDRSTENHDEGSFGKVSNTDEQGALVREEIVEHVAFMKEDAY